MKQYILHRVQPLLGSSEYINKSGQIPRQASQLLSFLNTETGELFTVTDLTIKVSKRNHVFDEFRRVYENLHRQQRVSVLGFVVSSEVAPSYFIAMLKKKLNRKGINCWGYIWSRDIGDIRFKQHTHCIIVSDFLSVEKFSDLFYKKRDNYSVILIDSLAGQKGYLASKNIYADYKQRAWSKSKHFKIPTQ